MKKNKDTYIYEFEGKLYINITNMCTNSCEFCVRNFMDGMGGSNLFLEKEPETEDIIKALGEFDLSRYPEVVFCGFGEPTMRLDIVKDVARYLKAKGKRTRLNTNGLAALVNEGDVADELKGLIDTISISLNASNEEKYNAICHPSFEGSFKAMLKFAKDAVDKGIDTVLSVVDVIGEQEIEKCREIAAGIGARFRVRESIK
ncbi:MAG: radical SAM protein [Clostridiales bacterium]|nr:radical SAM protein [Clostridiales bacterium]